MALSSLVVEVAADEARRNLGLGEEMRPYRLEVCPNINIAPFSEAVLRKGSKVYKGYTHL